ncbi:MAG TPA: diguanylate cyclase [Solirubrobacterales bacterium]|nr:diguanylate cyclase [Solirubrobacterales bacterium]
MATIEPDVRSKAIEDRLLEDSWASRSREVSLRELATEAVAGLLFLAAAGALLALEGAPGFDPTLAVLLVVLYALISRVEFPIGAGFVVPSYLVLAPMLVLEPATVVPLMAAAGLVLGAFGQWLARQAGAERMLFSIPDGWHAVGPALALTLTGHAQGDITAPVILLAAFLAACLFDLVSATLREAAALGVAPNVQLRVLAKVWVVDACLAPIGFLAALSASEAEGRVLLILPLGALLLIMARDRNARISQAQRRLEQALIDPLTRLGNRRQLDIDLREKLDAASQKAPLVLMVFDLDGFKAYNDTFGHGAGDALLERLAGKLTAAVAPAGNAYRLGGDEFCVLVEVVPERLDLPLRAAVQALTERGEEFTIHASYGVVLLPHETTNPDYALQLADHRMYARKHSRTEGPRDQACDVLMRSLEAREPGLHDHSHDVADLSRRVGRRLGLAVEKLDELVRAAELHDVGKVGIPDAILKKPTSLDRFEWEFMHQHTILGERILNAAPALRPVGAIVRSTHERWDGRGYPDGLAGEQIPLGARIVAVCDAYDSMVSDRPYRSALGHAWACDELRREAGDQFDPTVVDAFLAEVDVRPERGAEVHPIDEVTARLRELLAV